MRERAGQVMIEYGAEYGVRAECAACGWDTAHPYNLSKVRGEAVYHALNCPKREG